MTYEREQLRERLARQLRRAWRRWLHPTSGRRSGRPLPVAADTRRLRQGPLADTTGPRDRKVGPHPGHRTPRRTAGHGTAEHGGRPRACVRPCPARMPQPARLWPAVAAVPDRVRLCPHEVAGLGWLPQGPPCPRCWPASGRRPDTRPGRGHRHGHRHQPGHVCRTPAVQRAVVRKQRTVNPLIAPTRYNFLYSSSRRPCGRPPPAAALGRQDHIASLGLEFTIPEPVEPIPPHSRLRAEVGNECLRTSLGSEVLGR